jgi:hypothetical protein
MEQYHSAVNCALNMEDFVSKNFHKFSEKKKYVMYFRTDFTKELTNFRTFLYYNTGRALENFGRQRKWSLCI